MQNTIKKKTNETSFANNQDAAFSLAIKNLLIKRKSGHLGIYHYGDPENKEDLVNGSVLWNKFVKNSSNYYQFKAENKILPEVAEYVANLTKKAPISLIDFGPGSDTSLKAKTFPFLSSINKIETYIPVDICAEYLREIDLAVRADFPMLDISTQQKNYFTDTINFNVKTTPVFLFLSSNISNLPEIEPDGGYETHLGRILSHFHTSMHKPGYLVVSQDTNQDENSLLQAYEDPLHTAFGKNILHRIKRDAVDHNNVNFDPESWAYKPEWFPEKSLLAHSVYSTDDQEIQLQGKIYSIKRGEKFILDNSYKYKASDFLRICKLSGFTPIKTIMDETNKIAVHILEAIY